MFVETSFLSFRNRLSLSGRQQQATDDHDDDDIKSDNINNRYGDPEVFYKFPAPITPKIFYVLLFSTFGSMRAYVPLFLRSINFSATLIGITLFFPPFCQFFSSIISSGLCDKYQCHRRVAIITTLGSSALVLMLYFVRVPIIVILIIILNSNVWSPLLPILDSTTYKILGHRRELYGKQRMFGSIGFGVTASCIGLASQAFGTQRLFILVYSTFMFILSIAFYVLYFDKPMDSITSSDESLINNGDIELECKPLEDKSEADDVLANNDPITIDQDGANSGPDEAHSFIINDNDIDNNLTEDNNDSDDASPQGVVMDTPQSPQILQEPPQHFTRALIVLLSNKRMLLYLLNVMVIAVGMAMNNNFLGLIVTHDLHGSTSIIGIASAINVVFEIILFFFGKQLINKLGVYRLTITAHVVLLIRVMYYMAVIKLKASPWSILPIELLHGIIFPCIWNAASRTCSDLAPKGLETTSQSLLFGIYMGLGVGVGSLVGGRIYDKFGPFAMRTPSWRQLEDQDQDHHENENEHVSSSSSSSSSSMDDITKVDQSSSSSSSLQQQQQ
ncbi:hypothetical protein SAMD00019534_031780 [Acytostelium subglobosum LB1]|uniref:hypothetical protein n=1 Tax=Acytostelium subglobosum LB1 TaxID=1410327 RepID=UPI0006451E5C|nr:hypothetical protein SAMD00019534_031780 [Acytostelium subglobosum LB1]GAM20003.1 hypothetical protein SAMD00019534_031780 [Acytostelium subglobosum LB1]|eukprot:XP_012756765.1 hypothetical protein SAMD00019534_031780 [Acytostelium subglobosum LB1]